MRDNLYVPKAIANESTTGAVEVLASALDAGGIFPHDLAYERICRLLGWMCETKTEKEQRDE